MDETEKTKKRVAVYMRCASMEPGMEFAFEYQKRYYEDMIGQNSDWELKGFYIDEGVSGVSQQNREGFKSMIKDCRAGEIDLIVTRNISRFCRNIVDFIDCIRELKAMDPSVGVFFENEKLYTLDEKTDVMLSAFLPVLAHYESYKKSGMMSDSVETRYKRGIFLSENGGA